MSAGSTIKRVRERNLASMSSMSEAYDRLRQVPGITLFVSGLLARAVGSNRLSAEEAVLLATEIGSQGRAGSPARAARAAIELGLFDRGDTIALYAEIMGVTRDQAAAALLV